MTNKTYLNVAALIFLVVAVVHAIRIVYQWDVTINDMNVPTVASWVSVFVGGYLSYWGFKHGN